ISPSETLVRKRGFRLGTTESQRRREEIGSVFTRGYHSALEASSLGSLLSCLSAIDPEYCGFAFEGAAMALSMLDCLSPLRKDRLVTFLATAGDPHVYMVYVGAGWVIGRIPWLRLTPHRYAAAFQTPLRWLVLDGFGFHEGYFRWSRIASGRASSGRLRGY